MDVLFTQEQLMNHNLFLGASSRTMHRDMGRFVVGHRLGHTLLDLNQTLFALRKVVHMAGCATRDNGQVLVIVDGTRLLPSLGHRSAALLGLEVWLEQWRMGLLTNYKNVTTRQGLKVFSFPNYVVNLSRFDSHKILEECSRANVYSSSITNVNSPCRHGLGHVVVTNNKSRRPTLFLVRLLLSSYLLACRQKKLVFMQRALHLRQAAVRRGGARKVGQHYK